MPGRLSISTSHALLLCALAVGAAQAQWSDLPLANFAIADRTADQVQPKIAVRPGGGSYVSWFDNSAGGYDVRLQLLDELGVEQWPHDGVLVADRSFSSTQDYGLAVDLNGNALLAFRDDRFGGTEITAAVVDATGALAWGPNGVQLTSAPPFVAAPKVAGTTDGDIVVAWTHDSEVRLQRLDGAGASIWPGDVVLADPLARSFSLSDMHGSDAGSVIVSLVFQPSGFTGPKHLLAQKVSDVGDTAWGPEPLSVFDGGSLQFGNFPEFVSDGSGGAAFGWYDTSAGLHARVQHVTSAGVPSFPHDGVLVTTSTRENVSPDIAYDPTSASLYAFWPERQPGAVPDYGLRGQRVDATGARLWGDEGIAVDPLSPTEVTSARVTLDDTGVIACWIRTAGFNDQSIHASRVDFDGATVWAPAEIGVATSVSGKSRLAAEMGTTFAVLAWSDNRAGDDDVYVQNVNLDGTLGATPAGPGEIDDLRVSKSTPPPSLKLSWGPSCSSDATDYSVHEGTIAALRSIPYDHAPVTCTDAPPLLEETVRPQATDSYYLVVPMGATAEGSYGRRNDGATLVERPVGTPACRPTQVLGCP